MKKLMFFVIALALVSPVLAQEDLLGMQASGVQPVLAAQDQAAGQRDFNPKNVVARVLVLTPEQQGQWEGLLTSLHATVKPLREQIDAKEQQLRELMQQTAPDPTAVGTLVVAIRDLTKQIGAAHDVYLTAFEAMLTVEQKTKLDFLRAAERAQRVLPAFKVLGLLPPPEPVPPPAA